MIRHLPDGGLFHPGVTSYRSEVTRQVHVLGLLTLGLAGPGLWACNGDTTPDTGLMPPSEFCEEPLTVCAGECVSTDNDPSHCGRCGEQCPASTFCNLGICAAVCSDGLLACGAACVDQQTDRKNCGMCGRVCSGDRTCSGGTCVCPEMTTECDGACVDTLSSRANCGRCGHACESDQVCSGGTCNCASGARESACNDTIDDDCDQLVDCADPDCTASTRPCSGACGPGVETCMAGGVWSACSGGDGSAEICGDGIDQDCTGADLRNPDTFEPNDDCAQCSLLPDVDPAGFIDASFDSVDDEIDCYMFDVIDDAFYQETIFLELTNIPANNDYDLVLYRNEADCNARRALATSDNGDNDNELIDWGEDFGADDDGRYYVHVIRFAGQSCTEGYTLEVDGLY
jgi:hypothetical protein